MTWLDWVRVLAEWLTTVLAKDVREVYIENLALRQQLAMYELKRKKPRFDDWGRLFWLILDTISDAVEKVLRVVKPETVVAWHRRAFGAYWAWKSRKKGRGRPPLDPEIRELVRKMCSDNPTWGAPRIHAELKKLGYKVSERTVSSLIPKDRKKDPPSQGWMTCIMNTVGRVVCTDFFTVPTVFFDLLYVFVILDIDRRRIVDFGVTRHPTAEWTANMFVGAFPWGPAPDYLIRDRDGIYGKSFQKKVKSMGVKELVIDPRSPWQNPFVERFVGSVRRECLDHIIVFGEGHLHNILKDYIAYYHEDRTHLSLGKDAPDHREAQALPEGDGVIVALPRVGGLHHRYEWREAA